MNGIVLPAAFLEKERDVWNCAQLSRCMLDGFGCEQDAQLNSTNSIIFSAVIVPDMTGAAHAKEQLR